MEGVGKECVEKGVGNDCGKGVCGREGVWEKRNAEGVGGRKEREKGVWEKRCRAWGKGVGVRV